MGKEFFHDFVSLFVFDDFEPFMNFNPTLLFQKLLFVFLELRLGVPTI